MTEKNKILFDKEDLKKQSRNISKEDVEKLTGKNKRLRKILSLGAFSNQKKKLKLFIEIIKNYKNGSYKSIPWRSIAAITFTLLYIVNPLDVIPDILPLVGYVDDLSVFMALLSLADKDLEKFKEWKISQGIE